MFVKYLDGHWFLQQGEGGGFCVVKGNMTNYGINFDMICNCSTLHSCCEN
jgi:hypothetical protein